MKWFTAWWWKYLLKDNLGWRNIICRARGHRGVVFWNPGGVEPDYHCNGCDEDLS